MAAILYLTALAADATAVAGDTPAPASKAAGAVSCIANLFDQPEKEGATLTADAGVVCAALTRAGHRMSAPLLVGKLTSAKILAALPDTRAALRIVYYAGHGTIDPKGQDVLSFLVDGGAPMKAQDLVKSLAPAVSAGGGFRPSMLIVNGCDSGYVDLREVSGPITVLGAAYGAVGVPSKVDTRSSVFADAIQHSFSGDADRPPFGNCDGVITDREVFEHVNALLLREARSNRAQWAYMPIAVLRRNVDGDVAVAWPGRSKDCGLPSSTDLDKDPRLSALTELMRTFHERRAALQGQGSRPAPRPILAITRAGKEELPAGWSARLKDVAARIRWTVVDARDVPHELLLRAGRAFDVAEMAVLRVLPASRGGVMVELLNARDGSLSWASRFNDLDAQAAESIARSLPRSPTLLRVGNTDDASGNILHVTGAVPASLRATTWTDLLANSSNRTPALNVRSLLPAPCPGGFGQCFRVGDPSFHKEPSSWVFVP